MLHLTPFRRWTLRGTVLLLVTLATTPGLAVALALCVFLQFPPHVALPPPLPGKAWQPVDTRSADGVALRGWLAPPSRPDAVTVVLLPGSGGSRADLLEPAEWLRRAGHGVLLASLRRHDDSGAAARTFGMDEAADVEAFVALVAGRHPRSPVALWGFSAGAVAALRAAARDPRVVAVVADSAYASFPAILRHRLAHALGDAAGAYVAPFAVALSWLTTAQGARGRGPADLGAALAGRPLMFVQGAADRYVPATTPAVLARAHPGAAVWVVPGADHVQSWRAAPELYRARVAALLARAVPPGP